MSDKAAEEHRKLQESPIKDLVIRRGMGNWTPRGERKHKRGKKKYGKPRSK